MQFSWFDRLTTSFRGVGTDELLAGFSYVGGKWTPAIYQQDALMSVTGISSHDGNPVWSADYTAFGDRTIGATGKSSNTLQYTGRDLDSTGLYYYRARYYDPSIGRFISEDPLGFQAGINFYAYVNNNPVNGNDPTGQAGEMLIFPGYNITYKGYSVPLIHAGVIGIDNQTGAANYYQFGLYNGAKYGEVKGPYNVGTVQFDNQGNPTQASLDAINKTAAANYGQGINPVAIYKSTADSNAIAQYASYQQANLTTKPYTFNPFGSNPLNTCINFSWNALQATPTAPSTQNPTINNVQPSSSTGSSFNGFGGGNFGSGASFNDGLVGPQSSAADGGFLIYPNHPNTNQVQSVYSKP